MCGRYTLTSPGEVVVEVFDVTESVELTPRYNIAPTQQVVVVGLNKEGSRTLGLMRWGLVPSWAKDPSIGNRLINARSETAAEKPSFRSSFAKRRCLVAADGFYEWKRLDGRKQPHYIHRKDSKPFAIAGLWSRWHKGEGEALTSCTLLTTTPNALMKGIHDRMPVILSADDWPAWLDPETDPATLQPLMRPCDPEDLEAYPVSTLVNRPGNDTPACIEPLRTME